MHQVCRCTARYKIARSRFSEFVSLCVLTCFVGGVTPGPKGRSNFGSWRGGCGPPPPPPPPVLDLLPRAHAQSARSACSDGLPRGRASRQANKPHSKPEGLQQQHEPHTFALVGTRRLRIQLRTSVLFGAIQLDSIQLDGVDKVTHVQHAQP